MAKFKPKNIDDLEKIYGVGKAKSKKFSEYFLKVIQNH
jgi:superfamily II DNA helicase RecQ